LAHSPATQSYRPEIDGLRAIAIIAVVAFHAGLPNIPGGYLGVDVFFVISGYLITQLLLREAEQRGRIALGEFYARRVRRLLPALTVMSTASLLAALLLTPELDFHADVGAATAAASLYASNLYFLASEQRYFGAADSIHPMLHTWSLGVEEQFYVVWPALLAALFLLEQRWRWRALTALPTATAPRSVAERWPAITVSTNIIAAIATLCAMSGPASRPSARSSSTIFVVASDMAADDTGQRCSLAPASRGGVASGCEPRSLPRRGQGNAGR